MTIFGTFAVFALSFVPVTKANASSVVDQFLKRHNSFQKIHGCQIWLTDSNVKANNEFLFLETGLVAPDLPVPYVNRPDLPSGKMAAPPDIHDGPLQASADTVTFKDVVHNVVQMMPTSAGTLIDLGAGNSLATIGGLLAEHRRIKFDFERRRFEAALLDYKDDPSEIGRYATRYIEARLEELNSFIGWAPIVVKAVELSQAGIDTSKRNVERYNLEKQYEFLHEDMFSFLRTHRFSPQEALVSNPPYVPVPVSITDSKFEAVNGGPNGDRFINAILDADIPKGMVVGILWSSLTNPTQVIKKIEAKFEVVSTLAYQTPFGAYTSSPQLLPYLLSERTAGRAVFDEKSGQYSYLMIGTVLRKK